MLPTIALVGRPNVGKSTLFNKLTRSRDALVADVPGLTRDRRYGRCDLEGFQATLIDTGGLFGDERLAAALTDQTHAAIGEADLVLLVLDARDGLNLADEDIIDYLRRHDVPYIPVVNKIDGLPEDQVRLEFATLPGQDPVLVAAAHNRGLRGLRASAEAYTQQLGFDGEDQVLPTLPGIHVAVVGRPNVGKSTLVNRLLGVERQVVYDMPGTTKDAIDIPFNREGTDYVLIDTAGVRRKGRVDEITEKFSVVKALAAMDRAQVVILLIDANEGVVEQDLHVLKYAVDAGCGLVIAINKWDGLAVEQRERVQDSIARRLNFVPWVRVQRISALHGTGVGHLLGQVDEVFAAGQFDVTTSLLTRLVRNLVETHPAPSVRGRQIKVKMATRAGAHPPRVVVHGNQLDALPDSYVRYLENGIREALNLRGNPVRIELRGTDNPFAGRRNQLSERQQRRRDRVVKRRKEIKKKRR